MQLELEDPKDKKKKTKVKFVPPKSEKQSYTLHYIVLAAALIAAVYIYLAN